MKVNEIFLSCQGEGINAGIPTVFVRLQGCNLYPGKCCSYCDTKYAQASASSEMSVKSVLNRIVELASANKLDGIRNVCITGGEPLFQSEELFSLVDLLRFREYHIEIFTNATLIPPGWGYRDISWTADIKCPSSGVKSRLRVWVAYLDVGDQLKFTVGTENDLDFVSAALRVYTWQAQTIISPVIPNCPNTQFGNVLMANRKWLQRVWNFCIENNCRYSLQLHKIVFGNKKGV